MSQEDHHSSGSKVGDQAESQEHLQQPLPFLNPRSSDTSFASNSSGINRDNTGAQRAFNPGSNVASNGFGPGGAAQYAQTRQPINDAVTSAFNNAHSPLSPEILSQITSQITASVLQQLRDQSLSAPSVPQTTPLSNDHQDTSSSVGSPPLDRAKVYTPPSPYRASEEAAQTQSPSKMPPPPGQPTYGLGSPPRRDVSPLSKIRSANDAEIRDVKLERPPAPKRVSTEGDTTVLEKIWGKLFDPQGQPTVRLGQFLRGVAVHLIEDYEPKHSLVVTPAKMQKYYEDTRITNEIYPWHLVFDDRTSSISRLFRDLNIQHHLVQEDGRYDERPDIPGLTPMGFEVWATLVLRAHPDEEFERLAKTVLDMPINNPDDMKERFPKELSRRQFPKEGDPALVSRLRKPMSSHCGVSMASRTSSNADQGSRPPAGSQQANDHGPTPTPAPTSAPQQTNNSKDSSTSFPAPPQPTSRPSFSERLPPQERDRIHATSSISKTPSESGIIEEDEDESGQSTPHPIERERKPYSAQPGGGKSYDVPPNSTNTEKYESMSDSGAEPRLYRSTSTSAGSKQRTNPIAIHQSGPPPPDSLDLHRTRSNSTYQRDPHNRYNRNRSPSASKASDYGRRTDPEVPHGSYQSTSSQEGYRSSHMDRHDYRAQSVWDSRDSRPPEREPRARFKSVSNADGNYYMSGDDYHRSSGNSYSLPNGGQYVPPSPSYSQYPPSAYKDNR